MSRTHVLYTYCLSRSWKGCREAKKAGQALTPGLKLDLRLAARTSAQELKLRLVQVPLPTMSYSNRSYINYLAYSQAIPDNSPSLRPGRTNSQCMDTFPPRFDAQALATWWQGCMDASKERCYTWCRLRLVVNLLVVCSPHLTSPAAIARQFLVPDSSAAPVRPFWLYSSLIF